MPRPSQWAQPATVDGVPNLHRLNGHLYRSGQPTAIGLQNLERAGIRRVLNLRQHHDDADEATGTHLTLHQVRINTGEFGDREMQAALQIIAQSSEPILVHCLHGADRTGTVIALYRMVCQGWSKQQAWAELQQGGYGYHAVFSNIPAYLSQVDVDKLRRDVHGAGCP